MVMWWCYPRRRARRVPPKGKDVEDNRTGTVTNFSPNVLVLESTLRPTLPVTDFRLTSGGIGGRRFL